MSFIRDKDTRLRERSITLRRELTGFMALVTLWALLLNLTTAALFEVLKVQFGEWVARHQPLPLLLGVALFLLLCYSFLIFLAAGMTGSMGDSRRYVLLLPTAAKGNRIRVAPVKQYWVTEALRDRVGRLDQDKLWAEYKEAWEANRGRPISGPFYERLADAVVSEFVHSLKRSCDFLLSKSGLYHGVDYCDLARPPGECAPAPVSGFDSVKVRLPHGDRLSVEAAAPDRHGKRGRRLRIRGRYATVSFEIWPQWALLSSDYHAPHLRFALERMQDDARFLPVNPGKLEPALWVWEVPITVRVRFRNWLWPVVFLSRRFEVYADWVGELLERVETHWSWEGFVEHAPETGGG